MNDVLTAKQRKTIADLARKGCSLVEVATALGFTQAEAIEIFENEAHPFNRLYWNVKIEYTLQIRTIALDIAENSQDDTVRAKMLEFLAKENAEMFESKQMHTGFTNVRKLLSVVRQQFTDSKVGAHANGMMIAPKCKYLIKDLYSITWKEGERTQDKKNPELTHTGIKRI